MRPFDLGAGLTAARLLDLISVRPGGIKLRWDGANVRCTKHLGANARLHDPYRPG